MHVFSNVEPEPTEEQIRAGVAEVTRVAADAIIAVGGGSVLDAAKAMRLFHENPQLNVRELSLPFLDARKRIAEFPQLAHEIKLIAVPTTSGTGSEVSPAVVLTSKDHKKVTLVDYSLVPDMAIVDPLLTVTMPPALTADTGIDALTHALEAGVSIFASPFTDAFCAQAIRLIFEFLPRAYEDGSDLEARSAMSNAATIAGLAFSNAFLGINHALAHAVGARFGIAHGRANAIFLPHVLRYNASLPSKFMPSPGYTHYVAPEKYAQVAWIVGLGGKSEEARREKLFERVDELLSTPSACRGRSRTPACPRTSGTRRCPIWPGRRSWIRASARTHESRWSRRSSSCSRPDTANERDEDRPQARAARALHGAAQARDRRGP